MTSFFGSGRARDRARDTPGDSMNLPEWSRDEFEKNIFFEFLDLRPWYHGGSKISTFFDFLIFRCSFYYFLLKKRDLGPKK